MTADDWFGGDDPPALRALRAKWAAEDAAYWAKRRTTDAALQAKWNEDFMATRATRALPPNPMNVYTREMQNDRWTKLINTGDWR